MRPPYFTEAQLSPRLKRLLDFVESHPVFDEATRTEFLLERPTGTESLRETVTDQITWSCAARYIVGSSDSSRAIDQELTHWEGVFCCAYGIDRKPPASVPSIWRNLRKALHCLRYGTEICRIPVYKRSPPLVLEIT